MDSRSRSRSKDRTNAAREYSRPPRAYTRGSSYTAGGQQRGGQPTAQDLFAQADTNHDGVLNQEEFTRFIATSAGREALSRSRSGSPPASINVAGPDENKAAIQHIQIAIQMGEEVVQQMRQQGLDGEVDELR